MTIQALADLVLEQSKQRLRDLYPDSPQWEWETVEVTYGPKYARIDRGPGRNLSGMLMIEQATGRIYGIKGYGNVHKGRFYGTLDTVRDWYWGDYYPRLRTERSDPQHADWYASAVITSGGETTEVDGYFRGDKPGRRHLGLDKMPGWQVLEFSVRKAGSR